jgi:hypothetical protein
VVAVDWSIVFRGDDCDVTFPEQFVVRNYNTNLDYTTHRVIRYTTSNTYTFVYCMMRSSEKVTVRLGTNDIVAMNDHTLNSGYTHFSRDTPVDKLVCEMLTKRGSLVVLEDTSQDTPPTLF